ncbi:DNA/RNA non-specific endonuclease [Pseudoalteromonas sp. MMG013]|uniref:DNA/RNA non-specific endonuclease n=1 Tax=Pseudoalteromonas sp. MMG013 TaxID=2822687 RepID=UPI001B35D5D4|nr:DNA/RNA non-specific endonuclease [Pseudoalteromonas sp. MMG013]MBQ4862746.1 DNA/RNA non-specific endonuclease [Pseudoalteromonas sp. MMG013]
MPPGGDVNIAASAAEGAAANNAFFLVPVLMGMLKAADVALTAKELWGIYRAANGDPTMLAKSLAEFLGESALERAIPGFKTADEMIDWLKRHNYLSGKIADQIKSIFGENRKEGGDVGLPSGSLREVNVPAGSKGSWDKRINGDLEPNTKYNLSNGHSYTTDDHGRVINVTGNTDKGVKLDRNNYQQTKMGHDGNNQDHQLHDGGHLIATHLGGAGDKINLVPMTRDLNRKIYRAMERFLGKELKAGKEVYVDIKVGYPDSPSATRPNIVEVYATINGKPSRYKFEQ